MDPGAPWRTIRRAATAFALAAVIGFAALIVGSPGSGVILHEIAGVVILSALALALVGATKTRRTEPRPWPRLWAALAVLVAVGSLGGGLALATLPEWLSYAPLAGLAVLALLLADALRSDPGEPPRAEPTGVAP